MSRLRAELRRSWISLLAAPLVITGYILIPEGDCWGWLLLALSQLGLIAIAVRRREWGLLVVVLPMAAAVHNFLGGL